MTEFYLTGLLATFALFAWMYWTTPESEKPNIGLDAALMGLGLLLLWPVAWAIILYWLWEDRNDD